MIGWRQRDLLGVLGHVFAAAALLTLPGVLVPALGDGPMPLRITILVVFAVMSMAGRHLARRPAPPTWLGDVGIVVVSLALLTIIAAETDEGTAGFLHVIAVWVAVLAFGFLPRRRAWIHVGFLVLGATALWASRGVDLLEVLIAGIVLLGSSAGVGLLVALLIERFEHVARIDELTGLANRRGILSELAVALSAGRRHDSAISVVALDLDGFKQVNDQDGHAAGDDLLRAAALAWREELRSSDRLGRVGGDEFLAVLPLTDAATAEAVARRLREATPRAVGVSIGVVQARKDEDDDVLLQRADAALYTAKRHGLGVVVATHPDG